MYVYCKMLSNTKRYNLKRQMQKLHNKIDISLCSSRQPLRTQRAPLIKRSATQFHFKGQTNKRIACAKPLHIITWPLGSRSRSAARQKQQRVLARCIVV